MNLIIGNTSQISYFLPIEFERISSRNIDFEKFKTRHFDKVFVCFAEQRTFNENLKEKDFFEINVYYTSKVVDFFSNISNRVIIYGTAELWNKLDGPIDLTSKIDYKYSPYIKSKEVLYFNLINNRLNNKWMNVLIIHPFNFNSLERKEGFLFYKIYNSLTNDKIIEVGNLDINRDIIHAKYLAKKSTIIYSDAIIGSGHVINIRNFISDLFSYFNKHYEEYIIENKNTYSNHSENVFWLKTNFIYNDLMKDTIYEIQKRNKISQ